MVQSVNTQSSNKYGSVNRVGNTPDGRVVYKIVSPDGYEDINLSVPLQQSDTFEHAYNDLITTAPVVEKYMQTHTEDDIKATQKKARTIVFSATLIGGLIPAVAIRKAHMIWKVLAAIGGALTGLFAGSQIAAKSATIPGAQKLSQATQTISKLDIQPA